MGRYTLSQNLSMAIGDGDLFRPRGDVIPERLHVVDLLIE
jgi:hypothetical protein